MSSWISNETLTVDRLLDNNIDAQDHFYSSQSVINIQYQQIVPLLG